MNTEQILYNEIHSYVSDQPFDQLIDETDANCVYVGWSLEIGTASSVAKWRIKRIKVDGSITYIGWADSNDKFDNIWDNRASLTYSIGG